MNSPGHTRYKAVLRLVEEISLPPDNSGYVRTRDIEMAEILVTGHSPFDAMRQAYVHAGLLRSAYGPSTSEVE